MTTQASGVDVTLVTACFSFSQYHPGCRPLSEIAERMHELASLPVPLVIFGDADTIPLWRAKRESCGFTAQTLFREMKHDEIWTFSFLELVKANREAYWPTRDARTCAESHLVCCNKPDFVLQVMEENPFSTKYFAWIDAFLGENAKKICEDFSIDRFMELLRGINEDKFYLQILNVQDKKYKYLGQKREYYQRYPWLVCGSFFLTPREPGIAILRRLKEIFVKTTKAGYGHGEEPLFLEILDEFYDQIHRSYGDYGQVVNNFLWPTRNFRYVLDVILTRYMNFGYHREAIDCAKTLLYSIETKDVIVDAEVHLCILFRLYVAAYYINPGEALAAEAKIRRIAKMSEAWNKYGPFMESRLAFARSLLP